MDGLLQLPPKPSFLLVLQILLVLLVLLGGMGTMGTCTVSTDTEVRFWKGVVKDLQAGSIQSSRDLGSCKREKQKLEITSKYSYNVCICMPCCGVILEIRTLFKLD
jgi:hypothetical protein